MSDPLRSSTLPSSTTIQQSTGSDSPSTTAPPENKIQTGIASAVDGYEVQKLNPLFTSNMSTAGPKAAADQFSALKVGGNYSYKELSSHLEQDKTNVAANEQISQTQEGIKADREQALTNLIMSCVTSTFSIGSAGAVSTILKNHAASEGLTAQHGSDLFDSHAKKIILAANQQEIQTQRLEQAAAQADDSAKTQSDDRTDLIRASIQDFLDKLRTINPQI